MSENNKLWEGHRLIYPDYRDKVMEAGLPQYTAPVLAEDELAVLDRLITFALNFKKPILIRFLDPADRVRECIALTLKTGPGYIICNKKQKIMFEKIIGASLLGE
jgi:hypothetical protein